MKLVPVPALLLASFFPCFSVLAQLEMGIFRDGENLRLVTPSTDPNLRMMESTDLSPLSWRTLELAPVENAGVLMAITHREPARRFFQLQAYDVGGDVRLPPPYLSETLPPPEPSSATPMVPLQQFVFEIYRVHVAVPTSPLAVAFLMHDKNENAASFVSRPVIIKLINRLLLDRMAVVITESTHRGSPVPAGAQWDVINTSVPANLDADRLLRLWQEVISANSEIGNDMPLYTCGFGHGGHFALLFARIARAAGRPVNAVCLASLRAADVFAVNSILNAPSRGFRVFVAANGGDLSTDIAFNETAGDVQFTGASLRVDDDSFEVIGGVSAADSATIVSLLEAVGVIDSRGVRRISLNDVDVRVASISWPPGIGTHAEEIAQVLERHFARSSDFCTFFDALGNQNLAWTCRGTSDVSFPAPAAVGDVIAGLTTHIEVLPNIEPTVVTSQPDGQPGSTGNEMRYAIPANPLGLVFYFHGGGANSAQVAGTNQTDAMNALTDAGFAYVAYGSADRESKTWNTSTLDSTGGPDFSNPDWLQLVDARDYLIANSAVTSSTPIFLMGFSSGGVGSIALGYLAQQSGLDIRAISVHGSGGCEPGILRIAPVWNTPTFYSVGENDPKAIQFSDLHQVFTANGVAMEYHVGSERTLTPERFLRISGMSVECAQQTFDLAVNEGYVDSNGLRLQPMPDQTRGFDGEPGIDNNESAQFKAVMAGHVFMEEFKNERVAFFTAHLP